MVVEGDADPDLESGNLLSCGLHCMFRVTPQDQQMALMKLVNRQMVISNVKTKTMVI